MVLTKTEYLSRIQRFNWNEFEERFSNAMVYQTLKPLKEEFVGVEQPIFIVTGENQADCLGHAMLFGDHIYAEHSVETFMRPFSEENAFAAFEFLYNEYYLPNFDLKAG